MKKGHFYRAVISDKFESFKRKGRGGATEEAD